MGWELIGYEEAMETDEQPEDSLGIGRYMKFWGSNGSGFREMDYRQWWENHVEYEARRRKFGRT